MGDSPSSSSAFSSAIHPRQDLRPFYQKLVLKIILIQDEFKTKCTGLSGCSGAILEKAKIKQNLRIITRKSPEIVRFQDFLVEISGIEPLLFVCLKDSQKS